MTTETETFQAGDRVRDIFDRHKPFARPLGPGTVREVDDTPGRLVHVEHDDGSRAAWRAAELVRLDVVDDPDYRPEDRVQWFHGRGIPGTVRPREDWPGDTDRAAMVHVEWDDGAGTLVPASAITFLTVTGPVPYPVPEAPFVPSFDDEVPF